MIEKVTLTVSDVQNSLGIGRNAAYELVNRDDFPSIRFGRKILVPRDAFIRWIDNQSKKSEPGR